MCVILFGFDVIVSFDKVMGGGGGGGVEEGV